MDIGKCKVWRINLKENKVNLRCCAHQVRLLSKKRTRKSFSPASSCLCSPRCSTSSGGTGMGTPLCRRPSWGMSGSMIYKIRAIQTIHLTFECQWFAIQTLFTTQKTSYLVRRNIGLMKCWEEGLIRLSKKSQKWSKLWNNVDN